METQPGFKASLGRAERSIQASGQGIANLVRGPRRSCRVFGVGAAKTGTHTIGQMFADRVPARHEADAARLIRLVIEAGPRSPALRHFLRVRDRWRGLQIDASQVNVFLLEDLRELFPDSRYLLTVRPPGAWLRSFLDDSLRADAPQVWHRFRDFRFGARARAQGPEAALGEAGLYTLDGYLKYWAFCVTEMRSRVPADRLLVVRTEQIGARAADIARFAQVPDPARPPATTHAYRNTQRFGVLNRIPRDHLAERLEAVAGPAARAVLPGWTVDGDLDGALGSPARMPLA